MTKTQYIQLARIIRCAKREIDGPDDKACYIQRELVTLLKIDNPRFDKDKFNEACEP